jgi:hypothetical protein
MFPFPDYANGTPATLGSAILLNDGTGPQVRRARVVSYKLEVTPVGTILNQGGSAVTCRAPSRVEKYLSPINQNGAGYCGVAFAGSGAQNMQTGTSPSFLSFSGVSSYPDAKVISAVESTVLLGIPSDYDYTETWATTTSAHGISSLDTYPIMGTQVIDTGTTADTPARTIAGGGSFTSGANSGVTAMLPAASGTDIALFGNFWQSSNADMLFWAGQGLPASQPYEFRVKVCVELCISHSSSVYRPFITPPAPAEPLVVAKVRDVMSNMPSSLPRTETSGSWWHALTLAAQGAGELVSGLGIPVVSGAAGLLSKVLGKLTV